jgi:hypothetical protein
MGRRQLPDSYLEYSTVPNYSNLLRTRRSSFEHTLTVDSGATKSGARTRAAKRRTAAK